MTRAAATSITSNARNEGIAAIEVRWTVTPAALGADPAAQRARITLRIDPAHRTAIATTATDASPETEQWRTGFDEIRILRTESCLHIRIPTLLELVLIADHDPHDPHNPDEPRAPLYIRTDLPERLGLPGGRYDAPSVRIETTGDNEK